MQFFVFMAEIKEEHKIIAKGVFWGLTGGILLKLVSFVYTIIIARLFTQGDVGDFYFSLSIVSLIAIFSDLGISSAFSRYVPYYIGKGYKDKIFKLLNTAYVSCGILALLLVAIVVLSSGGVAQFYSNPSLVAPLGVLSLFLLCGLFFGLNVAFLTGLKKMKESNFLNNAQNAFKLILTLLLYFAFGANALVISVAFIASYLPFIALSFSYVDKYLKAYKIERIAMPIQERIETLREVIPFGITVSSVSALWLIISYSDRILLGYLLPKEAFEQIAVYSIAIAFGSVLPIFSGAVSSNLFPQISEMNAKHTPESIRETSSTAMRWTLFLVIPAAVFFIAFAQELLSTFYGASYATGAMVLVIFTTGILARLVSTIQENLLASKMFVSVEFKAAAVAAIINVVLNVLLIPIYGINGAALASALAFVSASIVVNYYCNKLVGFGFTRESVKPIIAGIASLVVLIVLKDYIFAAASLLLQANLTGEGLLFSVVSKLYKLCVMGLIFAFGCAVYVLALFVLRCFREEDGHLLRAVLRKARMPEAVVALSSRFV